ncbi:Protein transport protein Sec24B [Frankliniella fusca]|uniref:Protein transport protein Sec24B n=1 Tax=Frankliniella fusca TaxID=407009 RepID=A0AAE1L987_9NEOP|nr:Protein transport protein Sec24B [Frankliniella fusca]
MARWPPLAPLALLVVAGCAAAAAQSEASDMTQAIFSKLGSSPSPKLTLWTPGHLDDLHDALLQGRPLRAQLSALPEGEASADLQRAGTGTAGTHKLSLWVPRGQQHQAGAAANDWREDGWSDRSAVMVREAPHDDDDDDDVDLGVDDDQGAMSPSWLRGALAARGLADGPENGLVAPGQARVPRQPPAPAAPAADSGSLGHFRPKRAASPGPNEASAEDASVAADSSKRVPPGPPPQQAKAARSHQFVTGRNEKEPPPVVREVEHPAERPGSGGGQGPADGKSDARHGQGQGQGASPAPTHPSPVAAGSSRVGAGRDVLGRDALGLRVNEIPQGPRFSHVYESETQRHAADHRHYTADSYGSHNAYAASYGGSYGSSASAASAYPSAAYPPLPAGGGATYPPPQHGRNAPTATPRRIIYYASLPDPAPAPHLQQQMLQQQQQQHLPGASRVPHEYRGPPYDINGAYSSDGRYPPPPPPLPAHGPGNDHLYRYTIIDAEPPGPLLGGYRPNALPYRDRLPAASPAPAAFPQPYRLNPPLPPPPPSPTTDAGPQAASPIQYTQYDYNGIGGLPPHLPDDPMSASGARTASSSALLDSKQGVVQGLPPGVPLSDDPYRGFNPRQPAPWSMQVGTRLTVKDDGYGSSSGAGPGGLPPAARRFYVTSQQQPSYGEAAYASAYAPAHAQARFPRPLDRGDRSGSSGQRSSSEARNRLFR